MRGKLGMVEPVKAKKPYRIAYSSADMNADFFLALAYGVLDEAQQACDADALRRGPASSKIAQSLLPILSG